MQRRTMLCTLGAMLLALVATGASAQMSGMGGVKEEAKKLPSPPADATVTLAGKTVNIHYNQPHMRGRKIFGELVPFDKVWRTGANPATTLKTAVALKIGSLDVPAGTYTIYSLPSASGWKLIINKQTGQWGTEYDQSKDLGRTDMTVGKTSAPVEVFKISFEKTSGKSTELHLVWENTDAYVPVAAQ